jgi:hypothetical protein
MDNRESTVVYQQAQYSRLLTIHQSPEDGNRTNFQNDAVLNKKHLDDG